MTRSSIRTWAINFFETRNKIEKIEKIEFKLFLFYYNSTTFLLTTFTNHSLFQKSPDFGNTAQKKIVRSEWFARATYTRLYLSRSIDLLELIRFIH